MTTADTKEGDGGRLLFSNDARFANFMFELERLAAAASRFDHDFEEWIEMAAMAWGTVQGTPIQCHVMKGPPPEEKEKQQ